MEQLTLADEDSDMTPEPKSRISEHKKAEIRNICKSRFGSEFLKDHAAESEHANFSTILDMLRKNEFASVDELKGEAVSFLDAQVRWFQNPENGEMQQRKEMILMAEDLKQRFVSLMSENSVQSAEYLIAEQLFEMFPQLDHIELHRRVNHYLSQSGNNMNEGGIAVALAVNEISLEIFEGSTTSR